MNAPRIVVVGGGAGGLPLVTLLGRTLGKHQRADVVLVDSNNIHIWKPRFHEVATGAIDADLDAVDYRAHARANHYRFEPGRMETVEPDQQALVLAPIEDETGNEILPRRTLEYDYLVLAVGSTSNDFGTPGVQQHCLFMDSQAQAERFREHFLNACLKADHNNQPLSIAIVGGGATGVELAAEIHHAVATLHYYGHQHLDRNSLHVHIIEAAPRILPALSERVSTAAHKRLETMGVIIHTDTMVKEAQPERFITKDDREIRADILVWAAGVKAPDYLTGIPGLSTNRIHQIEVEPDLRAKGQERIYVVGDCAACAQDAEGKRMVPPRAQSAQQMAHTLAKNFRRLLDNKDMRPFQYHDRGSLVSLSNYSSVGLLMGNLKGGTFFVEGWLARIMYVSLYRLHQAALYGWPRLMILLLAGRFSRLVRPRLKLH